MLNVAVTVHDVALLHKPGFIRGWRWRGHHGLVEHFEHGSVEVNGPLPPQWNPVEPSTWKSNPAPIIAPQNVPPRVWRKPGRVILATRMPRVQTHARFFGTGVGTICTLYTRAHFALPHAPVLHITLSCRDHLAGSCVDVRVDGSLIFAEHKMHLTTAAALDITPSGV